MKLTKSISDHKRVIKYIFHKKSVLLQNISYYLCVLIDRCEPTCATLMFYTQEWIISSHDIIADIDNTNRSLDLFFERVRTFTQNDFTEIESILQDPSVIHEIDAADEDLDHTSLQPTSQSSLEIWENFINSIWVSPVEYVLK